MFSQHSLKRWRPQTSWPAARTYGLLKRHLDKDFPQPSWKGIVNQSLHHKGKRYWFLDLCFSFKKVSTFAPHLPDCTSQPIGDLKLELSRTDRIWSRQPFPRPKTRPVKATSALHNPYVYFVVVIMIIFLGIIVILILLHHAGHFPCVLDCIFWSSHIINSTSWFLF